MTCRDETADDAWIHTDPENVRKNFRTSIRSSAISGCLATILRNLRSDFLRASINSFELAETRDGAVTIHKQMSQSLTDRVLTTSDKFVTTTQDTNQRALPPTYITSVAKRNSHSRGARNTASNSSPCFLLDVLEGK